MSSARSRRRKTLSPRKLIASQDAEQSTSQQPEAAEDAEDASFKDPNDLANYIMHNAVINFVLPPQLSELYHAEVAHVKENTKPGEEMIYRCRGCNKKTYRSARGLKEHISHCPGLPKAPYTCSVCNESFTEQVFATDHIKDVHVLPYIENPQKDRRSAAFERSNIADYEMCGSATDEDQEEYRAPEAEELAKIIQEDVAEDEYMPEDVTPRKRQAPVHHNTVRQFVPQGTSQNTYSYLNIPLAKAFEWTFNRYKALESSGLPNNKMGTCTIAPNPQTLEMVLDIFHLNRRSPQFSIDTMLMDQSINPKHLAKTKKKTMSNLTFESLDLFEASQNGSKRSKTFYAGAPVWSMAWCPYPSSVEDVDQVLALSTHTEEHLVNPIQTYDEAVALQLWNCGKLHTTKTEPQVPRLLSALMMEGGPIWDMQWCPFGGFIQDNESNSGRLGILALALGCGNVSLLAIPAMQQWAHADPDTHNAAQNFKNIKPSLVLKPLAGDKLLYGQCFSVSWSVNDGCDFIAGGFATGHVALWDINTTSKLLLSHTKEKDTKVVLPFLTFRAHSKPVMGVAWCPFDTHIIATGGADKLLKVWDRRRPECDLKAPESVAQRTSIINEICWPHLYSGVYAATDSSFSTPHSHGCIYAGFTPYNGLLSVFPAKSCCFTVTCSDWLNSAAGGDVAGNAMVMTCNNFNRQTSYLKKLPRMLLFQSLALWKDETDSAGDAKDEASGDDSYEYKLVFLDSDMTGNLANWEKRLAHKEIRTHDDFADEVYRPPVSGVQKMRWNPNKSSFTWIASGTSSGLVRLHCVSGMISTDVRDSMRSCEEDAA